MTPPDPSDALNFAKGAGAGLKEGAKSAVEGITDLAKGGYKLATDPAAREQAWDTATRLADAAKNYAANTTPQQAWEDASNGANRLYTAFDKAREEAAARGESAEFWGHAVGRTAFEVGSLVVPAGIATKAGKLGEGARAAEAAAEGANALTKAAESSSAAAKAADVAADAAKITDAGVEVLPCGKVVPKAAPKAAAADDLVTLGMKPLPPGHPIREQMIADLIESGRYTKNEAIAKVDEMVRSGVDVPMPRSVEKGEKLYKLSKGGTGPNSPYFATAEEIEKVKGKSVAEIADALGLPADSVPSEGSGFLIQEIEALEDTVVHESKIAPLKEAGVLREGGGVQSLVTNRSKFSAPSTPKDFK